MLSVPKNITSIDLARYTTARNSFPRRNEHMYVGYTLNNPTTELFLPGNEVLLLPTNSASHLLVRVLRHDYRDYAGSSNYEAMMFSFSARVNSRNEIQLSGLTPLQISGTSRDPVINQQANVELQSAFDVSTLNNGRQYLRHTVKGWFVGDIAWTTLVDIISTPNY